MRAKHDNQTMKCCGASWSCGAVALLATLGVFLRFLRRLYFRSNFIGAGVQQEERTRRKKETPVSLTVLSLVGLFFALPLVLGGEGLLGLLWGRRPHSGPGHCP
jgi:hypothetical protein